MEFPEAFHGHPAYAATWVATYVLCVVPEMILSRRLRSAQNAQKSDKGSKLIVILAATLAVPIGFLMAIAFPGFFISTRWGILFDAGIVVCLSGILLRLYSIRTLGRSFTYDVAISPGQQVVERGPYRWLRHPSYLGSLLVELGFGMSLTNWVALFVPAIWLGTAYAYRIGIEEKALLDGLGAPYHEYMQRTWRLIPFVF